MILRPARRIYRPPEGPFEVNWASPQAANLVAWMPVLSDGNGPVLRERIRGVSLAAAGDYAWASGERNAAFQTNGTNAYASVAVPLSVLTDQMSMSCWINPSTLPQQTALFLNNGTSSVGWGICIGPNANNDVLGVLANGRYWNSSGWSFPAAGAWYQVTVTRRHPNWRYYVNGVLVNTSANTDPPYTPTTSFYVGYGAFAGRFWAGLLSDVRVYNRALSDADAWQLYDPATRWELYQPMRRMWVGTSTPPPVDTTIRLTWTDNSEGEDGFSIERDDDGGGFVEIDTVGAGVETYDDVDVPTGATYTYRVRALSAALGDSEYSNEDEITV